MSHSDCTASLQTLALVAGANAREHTAQLAERVNVESSETVSTEPLSQAPPCCRSPTTERRPVALRLPAAAPAFP